jgi:hypothetical protein
MFVAAIPTFFFEVWRLDSALGTANKANETPECPFLALGSVHSSKLNVTFSFQLWLVWVGGGVSNYRFSNTRITLVDNRSPVDLSFGGCCCLRFVVCFLFPKIVVLS